MQSLSMLPCNFYCKNVEKGEVLGWGVGEWGCKLASWAGSLVERFEAEGLAIPGELGGESGDVGSVEEVRGGLRLG